ncbi:hypothetical protein [Aquimarina algiphila]|uniref:DUF4891 domain-containing protein n=1 Tax=Aquimarina algiphila TaxID=2047982 RepID=A0A554VS64_9FLAO|nr:hypothetical protein [Aquimarina algiphila]TSE11517.1 hypothetical protein FOF46_00625 [Aquimarina algiphila]
MKSIKRKIVVILSFLITIQANAKETNILSVLTNDKEIERVEEKKSRNEPKTKKIEKISKVTSFHSVKKWKITIEYTDGGFISKTIVVKEATELSPLETAFAEAEKYLEAFNNVKEYSVSPISDNSFVLLLEK